jgi:DNA adenine methylase
VYAFWKTILGDAEGFCRRIVRASLTVKEWRKQQAIFRDQQNQDIADVGFSLFFLNRVNRSGILSGGLIGGLAQRGDWLMDARFPRLELVRRVEAIAVKKDSIRLRNLDAERFIRTYVSKLPPSALVYCDPPYFEKADRLYLNHYLPDDHVRIAETIQRMRLPWVVSYDAAPAILECYKRRRQIQYGLQYNASKAYLGNEVFVFCDELRLPLSSRLGMLDQALREQSRRRPGQRARSPAAESRGCA